MAGTKTPITDEQEREVIGRVRNLASLVTDWQKEERDKLEARIRVLDSQMEDISRTNIELEAKVADQALKIARMEGYLDRVDDDDTERAGTKLIEQPPVIESARPPRRRYVGETDGRSSVSGIISNMAEARDRPRPSRRMRWVR